MNWFIKVPPVNFLSVQLLRCIRMKPVLSLDNNGLGFWKYLRLPFNLIEHNVFLFPQCDLVLDAAHRKSPEPSIGPRKEDIVESIIFKASDVVVVTFKDVDLNFARKGTEHIMYYQVQCYLSA